MKNHPDIEMKPAGEGKLKLSHIELSPLEAKLLEFLVGRRHKQTNVVPMRRKRIAEEMGMTLAELQPALRALIFIGYLVKTHGVGYMVNPRVVWTYPVEKRDNQRIFRSLRREAQLLDFDP